MLARKALTNILLVALLLFCGGVGIVFVLSLQPSADKEPPSRIIDLSTIPIDSFIEIEWKSSPVVIFRPGPKTINGLISLNNQASPRLNPNSVPPAFIYVRLSTFRGCPLSKTSEGAFASTWPGGWHDPCHFGAWDYSGRWIAGVSGDTKLPNLLIPDYRFIDGGKSVELYTRG